LGEMRYNSSVAFTRRVAQVASFLLVLWTCWVGSNIFNAVNIKKYMGLVYP